jgi:DinB superfamily
MNETSSRAVALADFDRARVDFEAALRRAPDAALRFKPDGEDYTVGGLVVHVTDVLRRYAGVLESLCQTNFTPFRAPEHETPAEDAALIHEGFDGSARGPVVEQMRSAHAELVDAARQVPESDFTREAAVTYGNAPEPYPTSINHVIGWVLDHYKEHTQQVDDLISVWAQARR